MKIYHLSSPQTLNKIQSEGVIRATPHLVGSYDDYGQHNWEYEPRVFFCLTAEEAETMRQAFIAYGYEDKAHVGEFEVDNLPPHHEDWKSVGWWAEEDIAVR